MEKEQFKGLDGGKGSLISVFSGSTGTTLPDLDAIEVSFEAEWQRSFYLALRFSLILTEEATEAKAITFRFPTIELTCNPTKR